MNQIVIGQLEEQLIEQPEKMSSREIRIKIREIKKQIEEVDADIALLKDKLNLSKGE